jgi:hypothetical protein
MPQIWPWQPYRISNVRHDLEETTWSYFQWPANAVKCTGNVLNKNASRAYTDCGECKGSPTFCLERAIAALTVDQRFFSALTDSWVVNHSPSISVSFCQTSPLNQSEEGIVPTPQTDTLLILRSIPLDYLLVAVSTLATQNGIRPMHYPTTPAYLGCLYDVVLR